MAGASAGTSLYSWMRSTAEKREGGREGREVENRKNGGRFVLDHGRSFGRHFAVFLDML